MKTILSASVLFLCFIFSSHASEAECANRYLDAADELVAIADQLNKREILPNSYIDQVNQVRRSLRIQNRSCARESAAAAACSQSTEKDFNRINHQMKTGAIRRGDIGTVNLSHIAALQTARQSSACSQFN